MTGRTVVVMKGQASTEVCLDQSLAEGLTEKVLTGGEKAEMNRELSGAKPINSHKSRFILWIID